MTTTDRLIPVENPTAGATIGAIIDYLDGIRDQIGGYNFDVIGYHFNPGAHELRATIFRRTLEEAQLAADTLGVTFHQSPRPDWKHSYDTIGAGVRYGFLLDKDLEEYPETIAPRTGGDVE